MKNVDERLEALRVEVRQMAADLIPADGRMTKPEWQTHSALMALDRDLDWAADKLRRTLPG